MTRLSETYFRFRKAVSAVARYRDEVLLPPAHNSDSTATVQNYCVKDDDEGDRNLAGLNAADRPWESTVLKTKFTKVKDAVRHADVAAFLFSIDVVGFALHSVLFFITGNVCYNGALRRSADVRRLQMKFNPLIAQVINVTLECSTCHSLVRERCDKTTNFGAVLD